MMIRTVLHKYLCGESYRIKKTTDSQAAIALISNHKPNAYRSTVSTIQRNLKNAKDKSRIHWVPGHSDIKGNDIADEAAKKATQSSIHPAPHSPDLEEIKASLR